MIAVPAPSGEAQRGFVISSFGTVGDILPLLTPARELVHLGYPVTFLTSSDHSDLVVSSGAEFIQVYEPHCPHDCRNDVEFWRSVVMPGYHKTMEYLSLRFASDTPPVLIARAGNWAFRTFSELYHIPYLRVFLWPLAINEERRWMPPAYRLMLDEFRSAWGIVEDGLNLYRTDPGGPSMSLFPDWFGEPESRLPKAGASLGFPFYDQARAPRSRELEAFEKEFGPYVLFSASSGQANVSSFLQSAREFCVETKAPTVVLSSGRQGMIERISDRMMWCGPVPHGAIVPGSSMVVHNGGIGTVAQCIRAGVPQLVAPLRYDQPDNARRIQALGLGLRIEQGEGATASLVEGYSQLKSDIELPRRLRERAEMVRKQDAATSSVEAILKFSSSVKARSFK